MSKMSGISITTAEVHKPEIVRANSEPSFYLGSESGDTGIGSAGSVSRKSSLSSTRSSSPNSNSNSNIASISSKTLAEKIQVSKII